MTDDAVADPQFARAPSPRQAPDRLPAAAWALAYSCLAGQLVLLADVGTRPDDYGTVPSMLLGAFLVAWVSSGVLAARTGRLAVVWILIVLGFLGDGAALVDAGVAGLADVEGARFVTSAAVLGSLIWFSSTAYYAWQRTRPRVTGPSTAPLIAIAVLVGLIGGVVDSADRDAPVHLRVGDADS